MKKKLLLGLLLIICSHMLKAQHGWHLKENVIWNFADSLGLDFNNGVPDTFSSIVPHSPNCIASVSDPQGRLQFFTNSEYIWDKNGNVMPGGYLISASITAPPSWGMGYLNDASSHGAPQGTIILPVIGNPHQYYVFTLAGYVFGEDIGGPTSFMWLTYSIVDMTLNTGLGAVVSGPVLVDTNMSAHMTAVPGDNCNIWLVAHEKRQPVFKCYEITAAGVNVNPVVSSTGYTPVITPDLGAYSHGFGSMQVTPDRKKLAYTSPYKLMPEQYGGKVELFDFNAGTGIVSNQLTLDSFYSWDLAISADNSKLYLTSCNIADFESDFPFYTLLYQFDIGLPTPTAIINSKTIIDTINSPFAVTMPLRLTADEKIYYILSNSGIPGDADYLNVIDQPGLPGPACNNLQRAVLMPHRFYPDDNTSGIGCNGFVRPIPQDTLYGKKDTILCSAGDSILLKAPAGIYYHWSNGSVDSTLQIKEPGTYWVGSAATFCQYRIDTFVVAPPFTVNLGSDTVICNESNYTLAAPAGASGYLWQDGSTAGSYIADTSGRYWVEVHRYGCTKADTIDLSIRDLRLDLGPDISLCKGTPVAVLLNASVADPGAVILWNTGQSGPSLMARDTGLFRVQVTDAPCSFTDALHIGAEICECNLFIPTAFSPNQDGLNDRFGVSFEPGCTVKNFQCSIYNRFGQRVFFSRDPDKAWDGTWNGQPADLGTFMYRITADTGTKGVPRQYKGDVLLVR